MQRPHPQKHEQQKNLYQPQISACLSKLYVKPKDCKVQFHLLIMRW